MCATDKRNNVDTLRQGESGIKICIKKEAGTRKIGRISTIKCGATDEKNRKINWRDLIKSKIMHVFDQKSLLTALTV